MKRFIAFCIVAASLLWGGASHAQLQAVPPNVAPDPSVPMILLSMSKDYSMFSRAYTDYEDLDFDGVVDYTFKADFSYYGYFDPTKCYTYSTSGYYTPAADATLDDGKYYCAAAGATTSTRWSGNFLNWATMSRMDVLRKILFGGLRSTDSTTQTILEMSFVSRNSQAFVKFYNGTDLIRLTPFNYSDGITLCRRHAALPNNYASTDRYSQNTTMLPQIRAARGNYLLWNMSEVRTCNWNGELSYTWKTATVNFITASYVGAGGTSTHATTTPDKTTQGASYGSVGPEYTARVEVCNSSYIGSERCKLYPGGNLKPTGLLHEFGESRSYGAVPARAEFALLMGSFDNNLSGGVLRKNMAEINDEIVANTGQFVTTTASRGIIYSINELSLFGYDLDGGSYTESCYSSSITNGKCPSWGNPVSEILLEGLRYFAGKNAAFSSGTNDNGLGFPKPAWSDPMTATRTYAVVSPATVAKTRLDLYGKNVCRPLNMVTISSGVSTFDDDGMSTFASDLGAPNGAAFYTNDIGVQEGISGTTRLIGSNGSTNDGLCTGKTVTNLGDVKGLCPDAPNMRGTYLGAGAAYYAHTNRIRSNLTVPTDASADALKVRQYGISMSGGSAQIKIPVPNTSPQRYVVVTPASQDTNTGGNGKLPGNMVDFKVLQRSSDGLSGTFLVLWQHAALGEDQDQDMLGTIRYTVSGNNLSIFTQTLESDTGSSTPFAFGYTIVGTGSNRDGVHFHSGINNYVYVDTNSATPTYSNSSVQSSPRSGSAKCYLNDDGSTPNGWNYTSAPRLCVKIGNDFVKGETAVTYTMVGQADAVIQDPLWYIAKYGGFKDSKTSPTNKPDSTDKWDIKRADGAVCGGTNQPVCADGIPDNYFLARRPDLLEDSLRQVFLDIVETSNSAPAVSRPDLRAGVYKYVAQFDPNDLHGELLSYVIKANGDFDTQAFAKGHKKLTDMLPANRQVITNVGNTAVPFTFTNISSGGAGSTTFLASLGGGTTSIASTTTTRAQTRIGYMRGERNNERPLGMGYRTRRSDSILGGIVNSNPWLQDLPVANYFGTAFTGYSAFKTAQASRGRLIWVGANDGMLHAFTSEELNPVISYVPGMLASRLRDTTDPTINDVTAFMDGSPFTGDVITSASGTDTWKTYLFASLGRGGKGIFSLDVTTPTNLSEANAASVFNWQFSDSNDADLGYVISEGGFHPVSQQASQIAKMNNGKFAVLFGNGVNSSSGKAALYILFVDGPNASGTWTNGTNYVKLVVDTGTGNGLSQPFWLDTDGDGVADVIYAADLKGQMWKFDVTSGTASNWKVAYNKPLYAAKDNSNNALPITTAPVVQFHPMGGQMVVFGTGESIVNGDFPLTSVQQRIYGIWDKPSYAATTSTIPSGLTELQTRTLTVTSSNNLIQTKTTAIDWSTKKGWFMNIPYASGMVVSNPEYAKDGSRDIGIPMIFPADSGSSCNGGSLGVYLQISAITGLLNADVFGTGVSSGDGVQVGIVSSDQRFRLAEDSTARCGAGLNCQRIVGQTEDLTTKRNATNSRIFWREIPGLRTSD